DPAFAWMVTWSRLTFSSFEFCSAKGCSDLVSWYSPRVLCTGPHDFVALCGYKLLWILLLRRSLVPVLVMLVAAPAASASDASMPLSARRERLMCTRLSDI